MPSYFLMEGSYIVCTFCYLFFEIKHFQATLGTGPHFLFGLVIYMFAGFPRGSMVKNLPAMQKVQVWSQVEKILWRRKWQPPPVFLPGKYHGLRILVGYSPWGRKESDTTEQLHFLSLSKRKKNPCTTLRYVPSVPTF